VVLTGGAGEGSDVVVVDSVIVGSDVVVAGARGAVVTGVITLGGGPSVVAVSFWLQAAAKTANTRRMAGTRDTAEG
jgi:hypothetical protein